MPDVEPSLNARPIEVSHHADRVESPQQYANWRDYAFSEVPEEDGRLPR